MTANQQQHQSPDTSIQVSHKSQAENNTWNDIRAEGGMRMGRIGQIFQSALSAVKTELRAGSDAIAPAAKDLSAQAVQEVRETGTTAFKEIHQTWHATPDKTVAARSLLVSFAKGLKARLVPWYRSEIETVKTALDKALSDRKAQSVSLEHSER